MARLRPDVGAGLPRRLAHRVLPPASWSDDGRTVFVGVGEVGREGEDESARTATSPRREGAARADDKKDDKDKKEPDEPAAVEVWHARDIDVMPRQKINARTDRQRNTLAAWHVDTNRFVPLGTDLLERVTPLRRQRLAYAVNWAPYAMERTIGRPAADVYLVDIETGARTKVKDGIDDQYLQASPGGRYLLYLQADQYWTIDTATRADRQHLEGGADVVHQPRVGRDRQAEAVVRRRRLDEERRGRPPLRQVRRVAGRPPTGRARRG